MTFHLFSDSSLKLDKLWNLFYVELISITAMVARNEDVRLLAISSNAKQSV